MIFFPLLLILSYMDTVSLLYVYVLIHYSMMEMLIPHEWGPNQAMAEKSETICKGM